MAINPYHTVEEINGVRCSIIEKGISPERSAFLTNILESSGLSVEVSTNDGSCTIGVTDVTFNAVYALYNRSLKSMDGKLVTPAIWNQKAQTGEFYWGYHK